MYRIYFVELLRREKKIIRNIEVEENNDEWGWWGCPHPRPKPIEKYYDVNGSGEILGGVKFIHFNTLLSIARVVKIPRGSLNKAKRKVDKNLDMVGIGHIFKAIVKQTKDYSIYLVGYDTEDLTKEEIISWI